MKIIPIDKVYDANENGIILLVYYIKTGEKKEEK